MAKYKSAVIEFWQRYKSNKLGVIGLAILIIFALMGVLAPFVFVDPLSPSAKSVAPAFSAPQWLRLFDPNIPEEKLYGFLGTDDLGRDVFGQLLHGSRVTMGIGIAAAIVAVAVGLSIGLISGYLGGPVDTALMRVTDMILSMPALVVLICITSLVGNNLWNIVVLIGLMWWTGTARTVRSQVLSLRERKFVEASKSLGAGTFHIIRRHILPNVASLLFSNFVLATAYAIITEAGISFMGLGDQSVISWGLMIYYAFHFRAFLVNAWWFFVPPGLCISLVVVSFISVGQAMDEVFNPRLRVVWWQE